jgi:hypothetical protein
MSHTAGKKAAIDCTGYRKEMDNAVDLIINHLITDDEAIQQFIELQQTQESMWLEWRDTYGLAD